MAHMKNNIGPKRRKGAHNLMQTVTHYLNYAASNPNAKIIYYKIDMGDYYYFRNADNNLFNGSIYILATIIKKVMASAAEAEVAGLFTNANKAIFIGHPLIETCHPLPPQPLKTGNTTLQGILIGKLRQKRSKLIDMCFWWLKDRIEQTPFHAEWGPNNENLGGYTTKFHIPVHQY